MKKFLAILVLVVLCSNAYAEIKLPQSMRLAGPLDSAASAFGDEFYNFPPMFGGMAKPGRTRLSGWVEIRFTKQADKKVDFVFIFNGVGSEDGIEFPGGQRYTLERNRAFNNDLLESKGTLDLVTGEVTIEVHAIFLNTIIARVDKLNRIPFGFPNDYPPTELPRPLPYTERPSVEYGAKFVTDSAGNITGFAFAGQSTAPVTVFPFLGIFPPFAFGPGGSFYFANPTGCAPTAPAGNCPTDQNNPDGILLASNAFFHPHFELISSEVHEIPATTVYPPALPVGTASPAGLVAASGRLYYIGGAERSGVTNRVQVYDPVTNQWGSAATLLTPVTSAQSAALGNRIFVVGGWSAADGGPTSLVQVFDTATNRWAKGVPAPLPVYGGVAAGVSGRIYVIGGWTLTSSGGLALTQTVQIFDPATGSWSYGSKAPLATAGSAVAVNGTQVYVINGLTADHSVTDRVSIYDAATDSWYAGPGTMRGVYEASAGYINNRIYLAGGRLTENGSCDFQRIQILEIPRSLWRDGHEQPIPTAAGGAAVLGGKFYTVGGRIMVGGDPPPGDVSDVVQRYDPEGGWFPCNSRPLFTSLTVLNAASGIVGPYTLAPGSRGIILGYNFADAAMSAPEVTTDGSILTTDLPTQLNGITMTIDGKAAPISYVSPTKVEFQVPWDILVGSRNPRVVPIVLTKEGSPSQSPPIYIALLAASPGIYVYNNGEYRESIYMDSASAVARNASGWLNYPSQPAHPGETITLQVTGLGLIDPALENGQRAWEDIVSEGYFFPKVTIGGKTAKVVSVTARPREAGIYDLSVVIPNDSPKANNVPVVVTVNLVESNHAMISVK